MLVFAIIAVFVAGLMVGRTPEYLGKKIEAKEVKMAMLAILILPLSILGFTALADGAADAGLAGPANQGPHGFSEILYAYTSGTGNNGSAFAGLTANTLFYNTTIGVRDVHRPLPDDRADAGDRRLARRQEDRAASAGTFPTDGPVFVGLVVGVIMIVGGLTFFPALALGPIVEHLSMNAGTLFEANEDGPCNSPIESAQTAAATLADPKILGPGDRRRLPQARSEHDGAQSRHVHGRGRRDAHHDPVHPRPGHRQAPVSAFALQINLWLWFTVLFANFAEAVAEGRGKAQAATLRKAKTETWPSCSMPRRRPGRERARADAAQAAISCWSRPAT